MSKTSFDNSSKLHYYLDRIRQKIVEAEELILYLEQLIEISADLKRSIEIWKVQEKETNERINDIEVAKRSIVNMNESLSFASLTKNQDDADVMQCKLVQLAVNTHTKSHKKSDFIKRDNSRSLQNVQELLISRKRLTNFQLCELVFGIPMLRDKILNYGLYDNNGEVCRPTALKYRLVQKSWMEWVTKWFLKTGNHLFNFRVQSSDNVDSSKNLDLWRDQCFRNFLNFDPVAPYKLTYVLDLKFTMSDIRMMETFLQFISAGLINLELQFISNEILCQEYWVDHKFLKNREQLKFPILQNFSVVIPGNLKIQPDNDDYYWNDQLEEDDEDDDLDNQFNQDNEDSDLEDQLDKHDVNNCLNYQFDQNKDVFVVKLDEDGSSDCLEDDMVMLDWTTPIQFILSGCPDLYSFAVKRPFCDFPLQRLVDGLNKLNIGSKARKLDLSFTSWELIISPTNNFLTDLNDVIVNVINYPSKNGGSYSENDLVYKIMSKSQGKMRSLKITQKINLLNYSSSNQKQVQPLIMTQLKSFCINGENPIIANVGIWMPMVKKVGLMNVTPKLFRQYTTNLRFETVKELTLELIRENNCNEHEVLAADTAYLLHTAYSQITNLTLIFADGKDLALQNLFQNMIQLKSLSLTVENAIGEYCTSHYWNLLLAGIPIQVIPKTSTKKFITKAVQLTSDKLSSIANLGDLQKFNLTLKSRWKALSIYDVLFELFFLRMPKLQKLELPNFMISRKMAKQWEQIGRVLQQNDDLCH